MSITRQYELVYIMSSTATEQETSDLHAQIEAVVSRFDGKIDNTENWGRRKLAYEIGRHKEGTYVLELISGSGEMVKELDRRLRVSDQVIRHLIVRVDEELRVAERARANRSGGVERRRETRGRAGSGQTEEEIGTEADTEDAEGVEA